MLALLLFFANTASRDLHEGKSFFAKIGISQAYKENLRAYVRALKLFSQNFTFLLAMRKSLF